MYVTNHPISCALNAKLISISGALFSLSADCREGKYAMDPQEAVDLVDENTCLLVCILGTTYHGLYEDVEKCSELLDAKCKKEGFDTFIHVDAASGGFVAPFVVPDLPWDFRVPRVCSINVSGHKYGLAYAGTWPTIYAKAEHKRKTPS